MGDRGPDSAGFAIYRRPRRRGRGQDHALSHPDDNYDLGGRSGRKHGVSTSQFAGNVELGDVRVNHAVIVGSWRPSPAVLRMAAKSTVPEVRVTSAGDRRSRSIKEQGTSGGSGSRPVRHLAACSKARTRWRHTRMATESAVTTEHSHPFSTGRDLCAWCITARFPTTTACAAKLERHGITFRDRQRQRGRRRLSSRMKHEPRAHRPRRGAGGSSLEELDGFYHVRNRHAKTGSPSCATASPASRRCWPRLTSWVAMASEYRAHRSLTRRVAARGSGNLNRRSVYTWSRATDRDGLTVDLEARRQCGSLNRASARSDFGDGATDCALAHRRNPHGLH